VGDRAVTIGCDNMWGLPKCLEFSHYVRDLGFDLYMVRPAEWARGTPESLAEFYQAVAREMRVMLVGEVPIRTCELIEGEANICAFKEDLGLDYAFEVLMRWGDRWPMVGGGGMKRHHLLWPHGNCPGWLDVFIYCNLAPARLYWDALKRDDSEEAWKIVMQYEHPVWAEMVGFPAGGDGFVHTVLEACSVAPRWRRSPAPNATGEQVEQVRELLRGLKLL
jgi:dihydrodipicolinate synthase/N-acetylneuraminate lyase